MDELVKYLERLAQSEDPEIQELAEKLQSLGPGRRTLDRVFMEGHRLYRYARINETYGRVGADLIRISCKLVGNSRGVTYIQIMYPEIFEGGTQRRGDNGH